ncbi:MAG: hypothetical protein IPK19_12275 [Chloroflexi bacterium]|nr:hypothetical protein [Chloroflexota bacterium]
MRSVRAGAINLDVYAPDPHALVFRRGGVLLNEEQAAQFSQRIIDLLTELTAASKEASDRSRQYEIGVAFYPVVDPPNSDQDAGD